MAVLSLASILDDPARQIPVPLIMRTATPTLAQDGINVGDIRSQHFAQREQIRRLAHMDEDAYAVDIESLARSLHLLEEDIRKEASREMFGDAYVVELSTKAQQANTAAGQTYRAAFAQQN